MPTAGKYRFDYDWSQPPSDGMEDAVWFEPGLVCRVKLGEAWGSIVCAGDTKILDNESGDVYYCPSDFPAHITDDKSLNLANVAWEMNPWFEIIVNDEDESVIFHTITEALDGVKSQVESFFRSMCQIENFLLPSVIMDKEGNEATYSVS
jgi:hypothetical protein